MAAIKFGKRVLISASLFLLLWVGNMPDMSAYSGDFSHAPQAAWPPEGESLSFPVTRDTGVSSAEGEETGGNGGSSRIKLKGIREHVLMDADLSSLKGKRIAGALLHMRSASPVEAPLARVGLSAVASPWVEGNSGGYRSQDGISCFLQAEYGKRDWAYPGSTLMDVVFGRGHTLWKFAECTAPDKEGWQSCAMDPDVLASRVAGLSYGIAAADEVGHIWSCRKGEFEYSYFPNRLIYSRENRKGGPWLEVWVEGEDVIPPHPVSEIQVETDDLSNGEALMSWRTPEDRGGGKTLGFFVTYTRGSEEKEVPRYLIPMAGKPEDWVRMHLRDVKFSPGEQILVTIRAVDSCGNRSIPFNKEVVLSGPVKRLNLPVVEIEPILPGTVRPDVGGLKVSVVDALDKIDPQSGDMMPQQEKGYKAENHIFSASKRLVRLFGGRNETVAFQLNLEGKESDITVKYRYPENNGLKTKLFEAAYVRIYDPKGKPNRVLPDPLVPAKASFSIPSSAGRFKVPDQANHSLVCEVYVPYPETPGEKRGELIIGAGSETLKIDVRLEVWNFTLPDKLSFIPEMNAYGKVSPYKGYDYYRLAHEHRTCINRLPYGWHGKPEFAPDWRYNRFDWAEWDRHVGPLLDGSAFKDLPRSGEPVDVFYLPFSENWPVNLFEHYVPSYWADEAFTDEYKQNLSKAFAAFATHCSEKGWNETIFQFYLNNKVYYRKKFKQSSAPWLLDEPINTQDFWALRWYGLLWQAAVEPVRASARMFYRADVSYTEFGRNILWGITDVEYLGGNNRQKTRMKLDEEVLSGKRYFTEYGTANRIEDANIIPVLWCLSAWKKGAMGVLPWQTIGGEACWEKGEQTAIFYPDSDGPKPSLRLKAFSRGQQDVEYLILWSQASDVSSLAVREWVGDVLPLDGKFYKFNDDDAGTIDFSAVSPETLWKVRVTVGKMISEKAPEYKRALLEWSPPVWDPNRLPDIGYVRTAPKVQNYRPDCDQFKP